MDAFLTPEERSFRREIRDAVAAMLPPELAQKTREGIHHSRQDMARWNALLDARGWGAHHWPQDHGGPGWTPVQRFIFEAECAAADAPPTSVFGVYLVGPTIYSFGSEEQKRRYLPGIRSGAEFWCQGYSEPEAGSDLAAVRTTARKVEGGWRIAGQKAWTTEAHFADLMICLARTNTAVKSQAGLSLFVLDMQAPGVTITPVITIDGAHSVNSVFLDDVFVPDEALIGEVDKGWTYAKFLLNHERTNNAQVHRSRREFERLKAAAALCIGESGRPTLDEPGLRRRFAIVEQKLGGLEVTVLRVLIDQTQGREPGPEASIVKIIGSQLQQAITELAMDVFGAAAVVAPEAGGGETAGWTERHLFRRVVTIYAGANEIQKTIVARSTLGLR